MSEQVNKEQTKGAEQEMITELSDEQLAEAQGGTAIRETRDLESEVKPEVEVVDRVHSFLDPSEAILRNQRKVMLL